MKQIIIMALLVLAAGNAFAQKENEADKIRYSSMYNAGVVLGQSMHELSLQSIQGVRRGAWFAGLGAGIDYYYLRTVPVFIDIRRKLAGKNNALFAYADGGINIPWVKENKEAWYTIVYSNGLYYDAGLSYEFKMRGCAMLLSAGYSTKQMSEKKDFNYPGNPWGPSTNYENLDYSLSRVIIKVGIRF